MAKHVFKLEQVQDTVEVGNHTFVLNMNDEKIRNFRKMAQEYQTNAQRIAKIDIAELSETEIDELTQEASDLLQSVIDNILGAGAYPKIYESLGENTFNVAGFLEYLFEILEDKLKENKARAAQKYTQKARK